MITHRMKVFALVVLTLINMGNYMDRYIISALLPFIQREMGLRDSALGFLHSAFMVSYLVAAPFLGMVGDRMSRKWLAGITVMFWSVATALSGLAGGYWALIGIRSMVGIGEAGYGPVAPTLISDYFSENVRSRMLSVYYIGAPLGSALGLILGGFLGHHYSWRLAFLVAAIPGILLAFLVMAIREPERSSMPLLNSISLKRSLLRLVRTRSYVFNLVGTAAMTFAAGGLAYWFPTFLWRVRGWQIGQATQFFGAVTVVAGIAGTIIGGFLADLWQKSNRKAYFYVSAIGMLLAVPMSLASIMIRSQVWIFPFVFLTVFFLFFNMSPLNAAIISVVHPRSRATAMALNILFIHLFGDAFSTWAMGRVSDMTHSLKIGLMIGPAAILAGGLILILGAKELTRDQIRLETALARTWKQSPANDGP